VRIRYTSPALADLEAILDAIAAQSPEGARRVQSRVQALIDLLALHPSMGARTDDPLIRRLPITPYPYLIFYEPKSDEIIIHAVRHASRDPSSLPGSA
jgi:toxin ParE1/3/4